MTRAIMTVAALVVPAFPAAQHVNPAVCPLHAEHTRQAAAPQADHTGHPEHAAMQARGARTMGFDQSKASHHFQLSPGGGSIEIHATSSDDAKTRQQIVTHLQDIAVRFGRGDFAIPAEIHAGVPDGVEGLMRFKQDITYTFEPIPSGGRVRIATRHEGARMSVHAFLRYQIREHRTGDPTTEPR